MPATVVINVTADVSKKRDATVLVGAFVCLWMSTWFVNHDESDSGKLGKFLFSI